MSADVKIIREAFEKTCLPSFSNLNSHKKPNGEYVSPILEDHWQTFQEGWEAALEHLLNISVSAYSDTYTGGPISTGGLDPRNSFSAD